MVTRRKGDRLILLTLGDSSLGGKRTKKNLPGQLLSTRITNVTPSFKLDVFTLFHTVLDWVKERTTAWIIDSHGPVYFKTVLL